MSNLISWNDWKENGPVGCEARRQVEQMNEAIDSFDPFQKLNEATEEKLLSIKGIGPKSLKKILEVRPISSLDKLKQAKLSPVALSALQSEFSV
jgi:DNA uptake protein ComE-like DNA-binding protein